MLRPPCKAAHVILSAAPAPLAAASHSRGTRTRGGLSTRPARPATQGGLAQAPCCVRGADRASVSDFYPKTQQPGDFLVSFLFCVCIFHTHVHALLFLLIKYLTSNRCYLDKKVIFAFSGTQKSRTSNACNDQSLNHGSNALLRLL